MQVRLSKDAPSQIQGIPGSPPSLTNDLICFSHLRWDFVTQRPQHLMRRAARDRRVFYWEEPVWHGEGDLPRKSDGSLGLHLEILKEAHSLWIVKPHISWGIDFEVGQRILLEQLVCDFAITRCVRWFYTPMAQKFADAIPAIATVYDCMDELTAFLDSPPTLAQHEEQLFKEADVIFTGGVSLFESKRHRHSNVHLFPSSIDAAHFAQALDSSLSEPIDQTSIPHPRAGFFGVLDERLDLKLLGEVASLRPNIHFILLGPVVKIDAALLPQATNLHYLGSKSYSELPAYLSGWEVALIPFARNKATRFISPTKTPEYLAAGRRVVSTPIADVVREYGEAGLVAIAGTPAAFASAIDTALLPPLEGWTKKVQSKLAESSWDSTWTGMQRKLDRMTQFQTHRADKQAMESMTTNLGASVAPKPVSLILSSRIRRSPRRVDYLVVGAGFAGAVLAERIATQLDKHVLLVEKRDHIAGNAFDELNQDGLLVHRYGPHIFHTNSAKVVDYLTAFTEWRPYEHRVLASVDGKLLPFPINLDTINRLYDLDLDAMGMAAFLQERVVPRFPIRTSEDVVLSTVGQDLYERFFKNYTIKQWGLSPSQLDAAVAGRIPIRTSRDDRYFVDSFQAMPRDGYTRMFERMLEHPNIVLQLKTSFEDARENHPTATVIYTGPIDEFFDMRFGPLPYRSLTFRHETHNAARFQLAAVVNYPNDHDYTRVTEFKYLTGHVHLKTSIVYEYPTASGEPYYPIPRPENTALFGRYRELAHQARGVHFCGRLATYRYLNMDQVVAQALVLFEKIAAQDTHEPPSDATVRTFEPETVAQATQ